MKTDSLQKLVIAALENLKGIDIVTLDVHDLTSITDTMIICTGRSNRHVYSLAQEVITSAKQAAHGYIRAEGEKEAEWIIVDLGDVLVHIMQAAVRDFYHLEDLWDPNAHSRARHRQ